MQRLAFGLLVLVAAVSASDVTPIQKVIQLLQDLQVKANADMESEATQFTTYKAWCEKTLLDKSRAIEEATEQIGVLQAEVEKCTADADQLGKEIAGHNALIDAHTTEKANATAVRETELKDYTAELKDYDESLVAIDRALAVLKEQAHNRAQAAPASLLQLSAFSSPADTKRSIDAFLSLDDLEEQPAAAGYEHHSGGVVEMLEKLKTDFVEQKNTLMKEEVLKKTAYVTLVAGLDAELGQASKDRDEKMQAKATREQDKAKAEGDLADTTTTKADDTKYSKDLAATCTKKSTDFADRQKVRGEEIEAVGKAIEIISGGEVSGAADKHLPTLLQIRSSSGTALASLRTNSNQRGPLRKIAHLLQERADSLGSRELAALALRVEEQVGSSTQIDGAIGKVIDMINTLIGRMKEEAAAEATKRAWCDDELKTNAATRKEKTEEVADIQADIDALNASIAKLGDEVAQLNSDLTALSTAVANATDMRQKEKAKNEETIKDAVAAQNAVAQAVQVLKDFYDKAGKTTALVQSGTDSGEDPPPVFEETPYTGMGDAAGGVLGMIEVIQSDFARLEAETTAAEDAAAKEYEQFMDDSKMDNVQKGKDVEHKTAQKEDEISRVAGKEEDKKAVNEELTAAVDYFNKLKPDCVDLGPSYEERKKKREEELKSLKEALVALNGA